MSSAAAPSANQDKLRTEKISDGDVTCIQFEGVMEESFEGKRLGSSIRASSVILDMGKISKISSFGIREWSEFIAVLTRNADNIYMIECPSKVVDQINMVAGFLGGSKVLSFHGPYRCDYCDLDKNILFQVDRDSAAIRSFEPPEQLCTTCARPQFFDEDPASFFATVAQQPQFDLAPGVSEFLASKLNYSIAGGNRRLQIDKFIEGDQTFVRLVGNLDGAFPSEKIAEGLEGRVVVDVSGLGGVDIAGAAEWRNFVALARGGGARLSVLDCPPILLDRLPKAEDLGDEVISFSMPYSCATCSTTTSETIDVSEHYEILKFATPPEVRCSNCKTATTCTANENLLSRLRTLPKPELDSKLKAFIKTARKRKPERSEEKVVQASGLSTRSMVFIGTALLGVLVASGITLYKVQERGKLDDKLEAIVKRDVVSSANNQRPAWVTQDTRFAGSCSPQVNAMVCVGVSDYNSDLEVAKEDARNVALEAAAFNLAIQFESDLFDTKVRPLYRDARSKALGEFEAVRSDRDSAEYQQAKEKVVDARKRSANALLASSNDSVPSQHSGLYWEEYAAANGGTEFLVYTRFDITTDALRSMGRIYTNEKEVSGAKAVTAFPLLAWSFSDFEGGVVVTEPAGALAEAGKVVVGVGDTSVRSTVELSSALANGGAVVYGTKN